MIIPERDCFHRKGFFIVIRQGKTIQEKRRLTQRSETRLTHTRIRKETFSSREQPSRIKKLLNHVVVQRHALFLR